jgi:DNA-binding protein H-NS
MKAKNIFLRRSGSWLTAGLTAGLLVATTTTRAAVSDAEFDTLKEAVRQLSEQVQSLRQNNARVQQQHETDQQTIKDMQAKLAETQATAQDAAQKSAAASEQALQRPPLDEATVNHNFQILGDAEIQYVNADKQNGSFELADFAPIFLYRGGDRILFESGFDFMLQNNAPNGSGYTTTVNLSFAQLDYIMNDYMTFCGGLILLPLGTYSERSAGWLNKIPDSPLPVDLIPGAGVGAEIRGGVPLGESGMLLNYAIYGVNGPGSSDGTGNAGALDVNGNVGVYGDGTTQNLHRDPVGGARVAWFVPFKPHYDLELGVSAQSGQWNNQHMCTAGVLDGALHLGANFEAKGEYVLDTYGSDDHGTVWQNGWWVQAGYKLAGLDLDLPIFNDTELIYRYDTLHDGLGVNTERSTVGYVYYITGTLLFEGDYEFLHSNDTTQPSTQLILQLSYGF